VNLGGSIDFFVGTTTATVSIDIYRTGWYNGVGARLVTSMGSFTGVRQLVPSPNATTGMIACTWTKTTTLNVPTNWTTGVYLARLNGSDGRSSWIFFVVRNDAGHEKYLVQTSVTTYQAYNTWGGISLYVNNTNKSVYPYDHATKVSFDRPFNEGVVGGAGEYLKWEVAFVRWAESQGYDLSYASDVDTHVSGANLLNHKALIVLGHDEYWTKGMRDNVDNAISKGVHAAFFAGNSIDWQVRLESNSGGVANRVMVAYKNYAASATAPGPDPMYNVNNSLLSDMWSSSYVNRPENATMGLQAIGIANGDYVVQNASNWVYAGTGFNNGTVVTGIVGYEYDVAVSNGSQPAGLVLLSSSPMGSGRPNANSSLYQAASGAWVFAAGSIDFVKGLNSYGWDCTTCVNAGIQRMTANILNTFGV
jgi:hypothetical protein